MGLSIIKDRQEMTMILKALNLQNTTLRAQVSTLNARVVILETGLGLDNVDEDGGDEENVEVDVSAGTTEEERQEIITSSSLVNSQPVKVFT